MLHGGHRQRVSADSPSRRRRHPHVRPTSTGHARPRPRQSELTRALPNSFTNGSWTKPSSSASSSPTTTPPTHAAHTRTSKAAILRPPTNTRNDIHSHLHPRAAYETRRTTQPHDQEPVRRTIELNLLFDITLVIDAAIHNKTKPTVDPSDTRNISPTQLANRSANPQLRDINNQFENDFDATLRAALDGTLTVQPNAQLTRPQCDIAIAYGLQNQGAHNTGSATTISIRFADVQHALFRVLFATIEHLHP